MGEEIKILAFAASFRKGSFNKKLIHIAADLAQKRGAKVDLVDFKEFEMPLYDGDLEESQGLPKGALKLKECIEASDAMIISSPEYNFSIPGTIKNAIDWLSRAKPVPLKDKWALLLSASPSLVGGNRGLWNLRIPFECLGTHVYPEMFSLAQAHQAFDEKDQLKDPQSLQRLEKLVDAFLKKCAEAGKKTVKGIAESALALLMDYPWPGNVRELENVIERAVTLARSEKVMPEDLPPAIHGSRGDKKVIDEAADRTLPLEEVEKEYILRILDKTGGNKYQAAQILGIDRKTLYRKLGEIEEKQSRS